MSKFEVYDSGHGSLYDNERAAMNAPADRYINGDASPRIRITLFDRNPNRDYDSVMLGEFRTVRLIYNTLFTNDDGPLALATYIEGDKNDGTEDGWKRENNSRLYSDVDIDIVEAS